MTLVNNAMSRRAGLGEVDGGHEVADVGTKQLDGKMLWKLLGCMGVAAMTGRCELALSASGERLWLERLRVSLT